MMSAPLPPRLYHFSACARAIMRRSAPGAARGGVFCLSTRRSRIHEDDDRSGRATATRTSVLTGGAVGAYRPYRPYQPQPQLPSKRYRRGSCHSCEFSTLASSIPERMGLCRKVEPVEVGDESAGKTTSRRLLQDLLGRATVRVSGDVPYGPRTYRLVVPAEANDHHHDSAGASDTSAKGGGYQVLATLRAHRNILFGAQVTADAIQLGTYDTIHGSTSTPQSSSSTSSSLPKQQYSSPDALETLCSPLVEMALVDAGSQGEQPQAVATLHGLSAWVRQCLEILEDSDGSGATTGTSHCDSAVLNNLLLGRQPLPESDRIALEAVRAMATGIPRQRVLRPAVDVSAAPTTVDAEGDTSASSSVKRHNTSVNAEAPTVASAYTPGTMRDGRDLWIELAREYAPRSSEVRLYQQFGAEIIAIDMVTRCDDDDEYMTSAGGAMARMFFL